MALEVYEPRWQQRWLGDSVSITDGLRARYGGIVDRCSFYAPYRTDPERWTRVIDDLKSA